MSILGVDLGQSIGWVLGGPVGPLRHGTFELRKTTDLGLWLKSSDELWQELFSSGLVSGIGVEQPFMGEDYYPIRKLLALLGHMYWHASYYGISANSIQEIPVATGKKALSGKGNADADYMVAAALRVHGLVMSEHEAHAAGIHNVYLFGKAEDPPKPRTRSSKGTIISTEAKR